jgi:hypothetical protein
MVSYRGSWNGTYSYGDEALQYGKNQCGDCKIVVATFSGTGSRNESFIFSNHYCGFGFFLSVTIQKDDGSNSVLNVSSNAGDFSTYWDSTIASFGIAEVGYTIEC